MKTMNTIFPRRRAELPPRRSQRGVALIITLLLLTMLMALAIALVIASSTDLLVGGYYRNHRGSFYAADSGLTVVRQQAANLLAAQAPASFPVGTPPLPANAAAVVQAQILAQYGAYTQVNVGTAANSWPGRFRVNSFTLTPVAGVQPVVTAVNASGQPTAYQYTYNYTVSALGRSVAGEDARLDESGSLILNAQVNPGQPLTRSFASWGFFVDNQPICSGSYLVPGTISGPVHTNGGWTFGTSGAYIFTDEVTQVNPNFGFQFSSACLQSGTPPVSRSGQTINPTFQGGYTTASPQVPLPNNDFSQKRAVLNGRGEEDLNGDGTADNVTNAEMNAVLKRANGTAYPAAGASSGVYMAYSVDASGNKVMTGGGIHVQGDASVVMSTVGTSGQRFAITQGGVTTTITIDRVAGTTTMVEGGTTTVITGVPMDNNAVPPSPATMLYVQGNITALRGPAQGQAAIQDGSAVTITASANVTVTGDILYKTPPVTQVANAPCCPGTPPGTPIPGNDNGQVLGIFTATGDIRLNNQQSNGNLDINASMATLSQGGTGGIINTGARINTLNIVGGRIQNNIKNINTTTRNVFYDRRFSTGFAPPWFPATTFTPPGTSTAVFNSNMQRQRWVNMSAQ